MLLLVCHLHPFIILRITLNGYGLSFFYMVVHNILFYLNFISFILLLLLWNLLFNFMNDHSLSVSDGKFIIHRFLVLLLLP